MKSVTTILTAAIIAVAAASITVRVVTSGASFVENPAKKESVYDRVMRTGILRCGYTTWPPLFEKDLETGEAKGLYAELTHELASALGVKVEWAEEVPMTDFVTALNSNRVDMMCVPVVAVPERIKFAYFSTPQFYAPFNIYVRAEDTRFDDNLDVINDASVKISTMEGGLTSILARTLYPKAKVTEITDMQGSAQLFENVATRKADLVFMDPFTFSYYNAANPGKIRKVDAVPQGVFYAAYAMKFNENELKWVVDATFLDLMNRSYLKKLVQDYQLDKVGIMLPMAGYQMPAR